MTISMWILAALVIALTLLNIYQALVQRAALRIAEILYVMSRNVREKAAEVRRSGKDVEIIEAHLFDLATSARSLLRSLGRSEGSLGPDLELSVSVNGHPMDSESLLRLADNLLFAVNEERPNASWDEKVNLVLDRFLEKVPSMEREAARKVVAVVTQQLRPREVVTRS